MRNNKYIVAGILAIGILSGLATNMAFAEVPNGRVSGNVPEPAEPLETIGDTTNTDATSVNTTNADTNGDTPMLINESEQSGDVAAPNESNNDGGIMEISEGEATIEPAEKDDALDMWPVYLSLGAIALTLLLIFVINITHRKSQK